MTGQKYDFQEKLKRCEKIIAKYPTRSTNKKLRLIIAICNKKLDAYKGAN